MADLIDRTAVKDAIGFAKLWFIAHGESECLNDKINKLPAVDAEPVKHGRWKETKNGFRCSQCKREPGLHPTRRGAFLSKFCPNCGAKMDLEG